MELAALGVTIDARKAREENKALGQELLQTADKADALSSRGQKSMDNLATAAGIVKSRSSDLRKEMEQAERQTISWAQSTARLMAVQGNLSGAVNVLQFALSGATNQTNQLINAQTQLARIQNQVARGAGGAGGGIPGAGAGGSGSGGAGMNWRGLTTDLLAYVTAYLSLRSAVSATDELLHTKILFENLDLSLRAVTGSAASARTEYTFLREETNRLGLDLKTAIPEFIKIEAAFSQSGFTLKQSEQIFTDVSIATRALGLSSATTNRVLYDMQEMASLGTVQMRQMRQAIMQVPGGLDIAARAAGVTTEEFHRLMHDGLIPAKEFLPLFAEEMRKTFGGAAEDAMQSTESSLNRFKNEWLDLKRVIAEGIDFKGKIEGAGQIISEQRMKLEARKMMADAAAQEPDLGHRNIFAEIFLPDSKREAAKAQAQADTNARLDKMLRDRFPYSTEGPYSKGDKSFEEAYASRAQSESVDRDVYNRLNPQQGPPLPPGFGGAAAGGSASEEEKKNWEKLVELQEKFFADSQTGIDKQIADIERSYEKQKVQLDDLFSKPPFRVFHPGKGYDNSGAFDFVEQNGDPYSALKGSRDAQLRNVTEGGDLKAQAKAAEEITKQYRDLQKITAEIDAQSQPDKRLQELAEENQKYKDRYSQLIVIDEELGVSQAIYDKLNLAHQRELDLINEKFAKSYVGEGTLVELLHRRLEVEKELLGINENDSEGGQRARQLQTEREALDRQMQLKLRTGSASASDSFIYGWESATTKFGTFSERMAKTGESLAGSLESNMSNAIGSWITGTKSASEAFSEMTRAVVADLIRIMVQQLIVRSLMSFAGSIGGGSGGGYNASTGAGASEGLHTGGIAGYGSSRSVSAMIFAGAQRYHTGGVVGDEVPIVARKGEGVFTPEQMKMLGGAGGRQTAVHIVNVNDPRMISEYLAANPGAILNVINREKATVKRIVG